MLVSTENAELFILHSVLHPEHAAELLSVVETGYFSIPEHKVLWNAVRAVAKEGHTITLVAIQDSLLRTGDVVSSEILLNKFVDLNIMNWPGSPHDAVRILKEAYQFRTLKGILESASSDLTLKTKTPTEVTDRLLQDVYRIVQIDKTWELENKDKTIEETFNSIIMPRGHFLSSTYTELDGLTEGINSQDLCVIAGRPGMGKTAFALSMAYRMAQEGTPILFFNLDMSRTQLWHRVFSMSSGIPVQTLRNTYICPLSEINLQQLNRTREELKKYPFYVDSNPYHTSMSIRNSIRNIKLNKGVKVVFVDHIGKVKPNSSKVREREIGEIVEDFKRYAKEFDVTIMALSQLSREVEKRGGSNGRGLFDVEHRRPRLSDLRDSGAIEQEADIVMFPYRPEYYKLPQFEDGTPSEGRIDIEIAKNRQGRPGHALLSYQGECMYVKPQYTNPWRNE